MNTRIQTNPRDAFRLFLISMLCTAGALVQAQVHFIPPPGDNVANVRTEGARGDGVTDDTAALKAIFEAGPGRNHPTHGPARRIYVPDGTYLVSDTLNVGDKRKFIIGETRDGTVIRLRDNAPGFQDPENPRPVIHFGQGAYQGWHFANNFNSRMVNITVDVGSGNPGAVGVHYHTNNLGYMFHVTIVSSDPERRGAIGLHLGSRTGPGLIWDVDILGFDVGCKVDGGLHGMTVGPMRLAHQRKVGLWCENHFLSVWNLRSENQVPAVRVDRGHFVMLESEFRGGSPDTAAVEINGGVAFLRDIETEGYGLALRGPNNTRIEGRVDEWVHPRAFSLFGETQPSLRLPSAMPPMLDEPWGPPSTWTLVQPGEGACRRVQEAIDAGAETIYLVSGNEPHIFRDTIVVRNRVRRILGADTWVHTRGDALRSGEVPVWRLEDGEPDTVSFELFRTEFGVATWSFEHASTRTVVFKGAAGGGYRNTVTGGRAYFLDAGPGEGTVITGPQEVRAWQTNTESYFHHPHIVNDGGMLWIMGYKIEKDRTNIGTQGGGFTEVWGGCLFRNRQRIDMQPAFTNFESNVSISIGHFALPYDSLVEENRGGEVIGRRRSWAAGPEVVPILRGGETRNLTPDRLGGQWIPLYSGWTRRYNSVQPE